MPQTRTGGAAYMRDRRHRFPKAREYDVSYARARQAAIRQLIAEHRGRYDELLGAAVERMKHPDMAPAWPPPAGIDRVAVERLIAGEPPEKTTPAERREAVRILTTRRLSAAEIAQRLGMAERNVVRHQTALRSA